MAASQMHLSRTKIQYVRFGKYETEYNKHIKSYEDAKEDIENISSRIYGNVLTLMGIIVAIFSLLTVNYQAFSNADLNLKIHNRYEFVAFILHNSHVGNHIVNN